MYIPYFFYRILSPENNLETINLSYNNDLTSISLRRFIQHACPPKFLNFEGCDNILQYLTESESNLWAFDKTYPVSTLKSLKISFNYEEENMKADFLATVWEHEWGRRAKCEKLFNSFMHLSVSD